VHALSADVIPLLDNLTGVTRAHAFSSLLLKAIGGGTFQTQQHRAQLKICLSVHLQFASSTHNTVGSHVLLAKLQAAEVDPARHAEVCSAAGDCATCCCHGCYCLLRRAGNRHKAQDLKPGLGSGVPSSDSEKQPAQGFEH
jgi:hypothetical protein